MDQQTESSQEISDHMNSQYTLILLKQRPRNKDEGCS
jgi:hypothetical protein